MKLGINNRKKTEKIICVEINNTLTNNQWVKRKSGNTLRQMKIETQDKKCMKCSKNSTKMKTLEL